MAFDSHAFFLSGITPPPIATNVNDTAYTMSTSAKPYRLDSVQPISFGSASSSPTTLTSSPVDFVLSSMPRSITRLLMYTSPVIYSVSYLLSLITWSTANPSESCLLLAAWWSVCLFPRQIVVYGIHLLLLAWIGWLWLEKKKRERLGKYWQKYWYLFLFRFHYRDSCYSTEFDHSILMISLNREARFDYARKFATRPKQHNPRD
jgi:hypothetical protein